MKVEAKIKQDIADLEREELKLFHSYNRHAQPQVKLEVLSKLSFVITKLDTLKQYK
jgi:hypothetical protein